MQTIYREYSQGISEIVVTNGVASPSPKTHVL
jgi:hypothetical protein